ncbi:hypothetical protein GN956_G6289 [Arapaima gigas]
MVVCKATTPRQWMPDEEKMSLSYWEETPSAPCPGYYSCGRKRCLHQQPSESSETKAQVKTEDGSVEMRYEAVWLGVWVQAFLCY